MCRFAPLETDRARRSIPRAQGPSGRDPTSRSHNGQPPRLPTPRENVSPNPFLILMGAEQAAWKLHGNRACPRLAGRSDLHSDRRRLAFPCRVYRYAYAQGRWPEHARDLACPDRARSAPHGPQTSAPGIRFDPIRGSRGPIRIGRGSPILCRSEDNVLDETKGELPLVQAGPLKRIGRSRGSAEDAERADGELLSHVQNRARPPPRLRHQG